jgi:hypothetical protein
VEKHFALVQNHHVIRDGEEAFQIVADHHDGHGEGGLELQDELVQVRRGDGIEPRGGLVAQQDGRIQGHGPGQPGPLAHTPGKLPGKILNERFEAHQTQLHAHHLLDHVLVEGGVLAKRQGHVLPKGQRPQKRPVLEQHPQAPPHGHALVGRHGRQIRAVDQDAPGPDRHQVQEGAQQSGLAASRAAQNDADFACGQLRGDVAQDDALAVAHADAFQDDPRRVEPAPGAAGLFPALVSRSTAGHS